MTRLMLIPCLAALSMTACGSVQTTESDAPNQPVATTPPPVSPPPPSQAPPDWLSAQPLYGTVSLAAGFIPDPHRVEVEAGGFDSAAAIGAPAVCAGMLAAAQPDVRLHYAGSSGLPLRFFVVSEADTTLVINDPHGNWHCNDDGERIDPVIDLGAPASGQYDIWVGVYGQASIHDAALYITEVPHQNRPSNYHKPGLN